jgi:hypothetical protein
VIKRVLVPDHEGEVAIPATGCRCGSPLRIAGEIACSTWPRAAASFLVCPRHQRGYFRRHQPDASRDRFYEAAELILRAPGRKRAVSYDGRFYRYHYVNPWPRPIQKPHPPVWCRRGARQTVEWAAKRRFRT